MIAQAVDTCLIDVDGRNLCTIYHKPTSQSFSIEVYLLQLFNSAISPQLLAITHDEACNSTTDAGNHL